MMKTRSSKDGEHDTPADDLRRGESMADDAASETPASANKTFKGACSIPNPELHNSVLVESSEEEEDEFVACSQRLESDVTINHDDTLDVKVEKLLVKHGENVKSLEFTQGELDTLKKQNTDLKNYAEHLEFEIKRNKYAIDSGATKLDKVENAAKRKNLISEGIPEGDRGLEDLPRLLSNLFRELGIDATIDIDQIYRIGPFRPKYKRQILISFLRVDDRDYVFDKRAKLRQSEYFHDVWISDDVTLSARRVKTLIRQVAREAKNKGVKCTSTQYAVTIDGTKFNETSLNDLPTEFSLASVKTKQIGDDVIAYHSEHSPLSNLFPAPIKIGKRFFDSLEHALQYKKARGHNEDRLAEKIHLCREAYEVRWMGKRITTTEQWRKSEQDVMLSRMIRKFEQNPTLREQLLQTGRKILVEATLDKTWGAGCSLFSPALKNKSWPGRNLQGETLMKARSQLLAKYGSQ